MFIYQAEELESQGLLHATTSELVLQGKKLFKSVSISKRFRQAAMDMCQKELEAGRFCVLIEISSFFTLWKQKIEPNSVVESTSVETPPEEISDITSDSLTNEFLNLCQQKLNRYIGPIAEYIIEDLLEENPELKADQLVRLISDEIPNSSQSKEFKEQLLSLL
jgi:hypothetical protein